MLKIHDISAQRRLVSGKVRRDAYTVLSQVALDTLKKYQESTDPKNGFSRAKKSISHCV